MDFSSDSAVVMFVALVTLYSPIAALTSYMPIIGRYPPGDQLRLGLGLFLYVSVFVLLGLWVGEVLLEVLGISTAALTATGGVALSYEAVPLMLGLHEASTPLDGDGVAANDARDANDDRDERDATEPTMQEATLRPWSSLLLTPLTFPLTVGGATFGILVAYAATTDGVDDRALLTVAGLGYAAVTGLTLWVSGHVHRRVSQRARSLLDRFAGIVLTAIAVTLVANGGTRLVSDAIDALG